MGRNMTRDTILILEDDEVSRTKLVEMFQNEYKILEVSNEKDGIEALKNHASSRSCKSYDTGERQFSSAGAAE